VSRVLMPGLLVPACGRVSGTGKVGTEPDSLFVLASPAFENGQPIFRIDTADGGGVSPPLEWSSFPAGTRSLSLICEGPDVARCQNRP
jgi:phosphatidylethanolamine-binding protein (PEBP) family uncharacterized protein